MSISIQNLGSVLTSNDLGNPINFVWNSSSSDNVSLTPLKTSSVIFWIGVFFKIILYASSFWKIVPKIVPGESENRKKFVILCQEIYSKLTNLPMCEWSTIISLTGCFCTAIFAIATERLARLTFVQLTYIPFSAARVQLQGYIVRDLKFKAKIQYGMCQIHHWA